MEEEVELNLYGVKEIGWSVISDKRMKEWQQKARFTLPTNNVTEFLSSFRVIDFFLSKTPFSLIPSLIEQINYTVAMMNDRPDENSNFPGVLILSLTRSPFSITEFITVARGRNGTDLLYDNSSGNINYTTGYFPYSRGFLLRAYIGKSRLAGVLASDRNFFLCRRTFIRL